MDLAAVDFDRCEKFGAFLGSTNFPESQRDDAVVRGFSAPDTRMFYFVTVAICHQTTPIHGPRLSGMVDGRMLHGWDYLLQRWKAAFLAEPSILTRTWLMTVSVSDIVYILYDQERKQGSGISDPHGRARLLRDIGARMYQDCVRHVDEYYDRCGGWISGGGGTFGLDPDLSRFEAYGRDPLKKKLSLFLILMQRYGNWTYADTEHLGVPVDYHEVRLHLRLGTVRINDEATLHRIAEGLALTECEDVFIRKAVRNAIFAIARAAGRSAADIHGLFWNMARNCCRRDETHCLSCGEHPSLEKAYETLLVQGRCLFSEHCKSRFSPHSEKVKEPFVETDFY